MEIISNLLGSFWNTNEQQSSDSKLQQSDFSQNLAEAITYKMTNASASEDVISGMMQPLISASEQLFNSLTDNMVQSLIQTVQVSQEDTNTADTSATETTAVLQPFVQGNTPGFADMLDIVNPLQHIPLVNHYYQQWTGDKIGYLPQMIGSTFYGGTLGLMLSTANIGLSSVLKQSPVEYVSKNLFSSVNEKV